MKISACYIVKNEEKTLKKSLEQINTCVDEIIVVDTGSTDDSKKIAEDFGAKVYSFLWKNDFSSARNYALDKATGDWVLFLDADEYFFEGISRTLLNNILTAQFDNDVLLVTIYNIENKDERAIIDFFEAPRIFKNDKLLRYQGIIHEQLKKNGNQIEKVGRIDKDKLYIYHTGYERSKIEEKARRNLFLLMEMSKQDNIADKQYLDMYLAEVYDSLGDRSKAIEYARRDIESGRKKGTYVSRSHRLLLKILQDEDASEEVICEAAAAAVRDFPELPEFHAEYAIYLASMLEYDKAIMEIEKALAFSENYNYLEPTMFDDSDRIVAVNLLKEWKTVKKIYNNIKISACVITKNEGEEIQYWINNMKECTDEQILVDTGSVDDTVAIAQKAEIKVYHYKWNDDFAAAKNFAIEKATGDWIIFLDADETFTFETVSKVRSVIAKVHFYFSDIDAVLCPIINIDSDRNNIEISRFLNLRIFKNKPYLRYVGNVHEMLCNKKQNINMIIEKKWLGIVHTGYSTKKIKSKLQRNLQILRDDIAKNGEQPQHYRYLADCYSGLGNYEQAIKYANLYIESPLMSIGNESEIYRNLIDAMIICKKDELNIVTYIKRALKMFPDIPDFYMYYAAFCLRKKDYKEAREYFLKSLDIYNKILVKGNISESGFSYMMANECNNIAEFYLKYGDNQVVDKYVKLALKDNKYNAAAFRILYLLLSNKPKDDVIASLKNYYSETEKDITFILQCLENISINEVFFHYVNLMKKNGWRVSEKIKIYRTLIDKEISNDNTEILNIAVQNVQKMIYVALVAIEFSEVEQIKSLLPKSFWNCIKRYHGKGGRLSEFDWDGYSAILLMLVHYGDNTVIEKFSEMRKDFSIEYIKNMFYILCQKSCWKEARWFLNDVFFSADDDINIDKFRLIGLCLYYAGEFELASDYLNKARENGDESVEILSYLQWIDEKLKGTQK